MNQRVENKKEKKKLKEKKNRNRKRNRKQKNKLGSPKHSENEPSFTKNPWN
jgi:hypothetical protein